MKKRGSRNSGAQIIDGPAKNLQFLLKISRIKIVVIGKEKKSYNFLTERLRGSNQEENRLTLHGII